MSSLEQNLWLVIPPCSDREAWVAAITSQAEHAGFTVIHSSAGVEPAVSGRTLTLSQDAREASKAGIQGKDVAVILSSSGPLLPGLDRDDQPAPRHAAVRNASALIQRGYDFFPGRVFNAKEFIGSAIELFPGLRLHGPKSVSASARNSALQQAFSIYAAGQAFWSSEIFDINAKDVRYNNGQAALDLTGRPRILIFGPYIVMPRGRWRAVVRLGFSAPTAKYQYRADWGAQETYSSYHFRPGRDGMFELEIDYEWNEPSASEFRLLLLEGAFDGEVTFFGADIARIG